MNVVWLVLVVAVADASTRWWPTIETHPYSFRAGQLILTVIATALLAAHAGVCWQHMVFEEVLKNHPVVEKVVGERAPLCTLRVWTGRWVINKPTTHAAFLVARSGSISNCKNNECWRVNLDKHTATLQSSGTTIVLPWVAEAIFTASFLKCPSLGQTLG